jgi:uncharacterized membrane protein YeaQ/YmgE (transglycosylase-associated protein family)
MTQGTGSDRGIFTHSLRGDSSMPLLELLILLVIAGLAGAIAEFLIGFSPGGMLFSVIVGVIGAYIGNWLANLLGVPSIVPITVGSRTIDILWSTLG